MQDRGPKGNAALRVAKFCQPLLDPAAYCGKVGMRQEGCQTP